MSDDEVSAKARALKVIERLPEDCSYEDMMYSLYVLENIEIGLADAKAGRTVSHEEVMRELAEWRQSVGL